MKGVPILAAAAVGGAVLQGLTAIPGYAGTASGSFVWAVVASTALLWGQVTVMACAAVAAVGARPSPATAFAWSGAVLLVGLALAVAMPVLLPAAAAVAACLLAAAGRGERNAFGGFRAFRRHPVRAGLAILAALVLCALTWVVAFASGLFLTGAWGGIVTWLWSGLCAAVLLVWWARLQRPVAQPENAASIARSPELKRIVRR